VLIKDMTKTEAEELALGYVKAEEARAGFELVLLKDQTIERSFGWVFFYDSKRHNETRDLRDAVAGNAPIVVTRDETGTALPLEAYLKDFDKLNSS
jgi:hypothetical protein